MDNGNGNGNGKNSPPSDRPKRALVLPGGGGRGAYQVGVAKALIQEGIEFDLAFGTSVGGLNACFIAQGQLARLEELWNGLRARDVFKFPSASQIASTVLGAKLGLLDTSPLQALLRKELNLHALKSSRTKVGLFTTDLCSLETRLITMDDIMSSEELLDVLMATAALPLAFPPRHLHGKGLWVDGGLVKNTPMKAAIDIGAEEIFMVLLHPETIDACPTNMWQVLARCLDIVLDASARRELEIAHMYNRLIGEGSAESVGMRHVDIHVFQPRRQLDTTLLEISPERSKTLIQQGYEDALELLANDYFQEKLAVKN
jgi:NTE family protein